MVVEFAHHCAISPQKFNGLHRFGYISAIKSVMVGVAIAQDPTTHCQSFGKLFFISQIIQPKTFRKR
jgi:hypothetical protein